MVFSVDNAINEFNRKSVIVSGKGEKKQEAFADALSNLRKEVLENKNTVTLQIIPEEISIIEAKESNYEERFLFFFFKRIRTNFQIKLRVQVKINTVNLNSIKFEDFSFETYKQKSLIKKFMRGEF